MDRLGRNRVRRAYAYQELKAQLGLVALGTDFPVEGIAPLNSFYAAVVRKDKQGDPENGFQTDNALTREEALMGMTIWAAVANFEEGEKGMLQAGMKGDFVILDKNLLNVAEDDILNVKILLTAVGGEIVYQADGTNLSIRN